MTWENTSKLTRQDEGHHPDGGAHAKFTNYSFDVDEFVRLVKLLAEHVLRHPDFETNLDLIVEKTNDSSNQLYHDEF